MCASRAKECQEENLSEILFVFLFGGKIKNETKSSVCWPRESEIFLQKITTTTAIKK